MQGNVEQMDLKALIDAYERAPAAYGRAADVDDADEANSHHDVIAGVYRELRRRGSEAQRKLLPLLQSADIWVKSWAAAHALEFAPNEGEPALRLIEAQPRSLLALSAKMTLREWCAGRLRFP